MADETEGADAYDPTDPYNREEQTFPRLQRDQISRIEAFGEGGDWLDGCVALDRGGFVITGQDAQGQALPSPYVTGRPGLFAVGDVRSGSTKRIASGVGEGSVVVSAVHAYPAGLREVV